MARLILCLLGSLWFLPVTIQAETWYVLALTEGSGLVLKQDDERLHEVNPRLHTISAGLDLPRETMITVKTSEGEILGEVLSTAGGMRRLLILGERWSCFSLLEMPVLRPSEFHVVNLSSGPLIYHFGDERVRLAESSIHTHHDAVQTAILQVATYDGKRYHRVFSGLVGLPPEGGSFAVVLPPLREGSKRYRVLFRDYYPDAPEE